MDPFCGGGVTVYEGLKLRRKVIAIDINPLATWITKMQVINLDLGAIEKAYELLTQEFEPIAKELYCSECEDCGADVEVDWFEWSNVYLCPGCGGKVILAKAKKLRGGLFECPNEKCISVLKISDCQKDSETMIFKKYNCPKCKDKIIEVNQKDIDKVAKLEENFEKIIKKEKLYIPTIPFPDGDRERIDRILARGYKDFTYFFTKRNLIALSRLKKIINSCQDLKIQEVLHFVFSGALRFTNKMVFRTSKWQGGQPIEWASHAFWLPNTFIERNVKWAFKNRKNALIRGKKQSQNEIGDYAVPFPNPNATFEIWTQTSESTGLPTKYVDCVITDPPFGANVQYAELSDFWTVWLPEVEGMGFLINNEREVIQTMHKDFPTAKGFEHYEKLLYRIFSECHRVLKDGGYMVMTFHNRDVSVWMALHRAARRAGFKLPSYEEVRNRGMVYQDYIENYKQTFHKRATGSLLGDFILTFKKDKVPDQIDDILYDLPISQQKEFIEKIEESIKYHGGLDENSMGIVVVEILEKMNLIHRFLGSDIRNLYQAHLVYSKEDKKWYLPSMVDSNNRPIKLLDYLPVEQTIERILYSFFKEKEYASMDEILKLIYTSLVNSQRPGLDAVAKVLNRCCEKKKVKGQKREVYCWIKNIPKYEIDNQTTIIFKDYIEHNRFIEKLARKYLIDGKKVHIGSTEQRKDEKLQELSTDLTSYELGIKPEALNVIKEIDLLIFDKNNIIKAVEVVTTFETFNKAINDRFRNLLILIPNLKFDLEIYVCQSFFEKSFRDLNSPANIKDGINTKIKLIPIDNC